MTCRCLHQFCWVCGSYPFHNRLIHIVKMAILVLFGLFGLFIILFLLWQIPIVKKIGYWLFPKIISLALVTAVDFTFRNAILNKSLKWKSRFFIKELSVVGTVVGCGYIAFFRLFECLQIALLISSIVLVIKIILCLKNRR